MKRRSRLGERLNRALTEVGIEHFDDDKDWDERVKLPAWQTARLRARYEDRARQRSSNRQNPEPDEKHTGRRDED